MTALAPSVLPGVGRFSNGLDAALVLPALVARQGKQPDLPSALILVVVGIMAPWMFDLARRTGGALRQC
jgi:hypothetical protein